MIEVGNSGEFVVYISLSLFNAVNQRSLTQLPQNLQNNGHFNLKKFEQ